MVALFYSNSINVLFQSNVEVFKNSLRGTCNVLQLRQWAAQLNILFTGKGSDARLLKWGNRKPTHTAA